MPAGYIILINTSYENFIWVKDKVGVEGFKRTTRLEVAILDHVKRIRSLTLALR